MNLKYKTQVMRIGQKTQWHVSLLKINERLPNVRGEIEGRIQGGCMSLFPLPMIQKHLLKSHLLRGSEEGGRREYSKELSFHPG